MPPDTSSAADTAHAEYVSRCTAGGSAASLDHPAPPEGRTSALAGSAGGVVDPSPCLAPPIDVALARPRPAGAAGIFSASTARHEPDGPRRGGGLAEPSTADTALVMNVSRRVVGGSAATLLDHPAPPEVHSLASHDAAGGAVDSSLPPIGLPGAITSAEWDTAADGRELFTADETASTVDVHAWAMLRQAARAFTEVQETRKRLHNQISPTKADGSLRKDSATRGGDLVELAKVLVAIEECEKTAEKTLRECWRQTVGKDTPLARLPEETPGLGWLSLARLLGETGHPLLASPKHWEERTKGPKKRVLVPDPTYIRTQRQWISYCGLGDPKRRRKAGMTQEGLLSCGSPRIKTAAWTVAIAGYRSSTGQADKNGRVCREFPWRATYQAARARSEANHPDWLGKHHQASAERVMTKAVLIHIYRTAWADVAARLAAE